MARWENEDVSDLNLPDRLLVLEDLKRFQKTVLTFT